MKLTDLLNQYRNKIHTHESPVDTDKLWKALQPSLIRDEKRRRKLWPLLFLSLFVLIGIGGAVSLVLYTGDQSKVAREKDQGSATMKNHPSSAVTSTAPLGEDQAKTFKDIVEGEKPESMKEVSRNQSRRSDNEEMASDVRTSHQGHETVKNSSATHLDERKSRRQNSPDEKANQGLPQDEIDQNEQQEPMEHDGVDSRQREHPIARGVTSCTTQMTLGSDWAVPLLPYKCLPTISQDTDLKGRVGQAPSLIAVKEKSSKQVKTSLRAFDLGFEAYGGLGYSPRQLKASSADAEAIAALRKETETILESSTLGLSAHIRHMSGLGLSIGVNRTRLIERMDYTTTQEESVTREGIVSYRIDFDGDTIPQMGMMEGIEKTYLQKRTYNRLTQYNIPVLAHYHFGLGQFTGSIFAGINANISLKATGQTTDGPGEFIDFEANGDHFKSNLGIGWKGGFSLGYGIGENVELRVAPTYAVFPGSWTQDDGVSRHYHHFTVEAGLVFWPGR